MTSLNMLELFGDNWRTWKLQDRIKVNSLYKFDDCVLPFLHLHTEKYLTKYINTHDSCEEINVKCVDCIYKDDCKIKSLENLIDYTGLDGNSYKCVEEEYTEISHVLYSRERNIVVVTEISCLDMFEAGLLAVMGDDDLHDLIYFSIFIFNSMFRKVYNYMIDKFIREKNKIVIIAGIPPFVWIFNDIDAKSHLLKGGFNIIHELGSKVVDKDFNAMNNFLEFNGEYKLLANN